MDTEYVAKGSLYSDLFHITLSQQIQDNKLFGNLTLLFPF
jgi:hypothetical protein